MVGYLVVDRLKYWQCVRPLLNQLFLLTNAFKITLQKETPIFICQLHDHTFGVFVVTISTMTRPLFTRDAILAPSTAILTSLPQNCHGSVRYWDVCALCPCWCIAAASNIDLYQPTQESIYTHYYQSIHFPRWLYTQEACSESVTPKIWNNFHNQRNCYQWLSPWLVLEGHHRKQS